MSIHLHRAHDLDDDLATRVDALADRVKETDGFAAFDEQTTLNFRTAGTSLYVYLLDDDESLVGLAAADLRNRSVELAVDPDHRRRGYGTQLLTAMRDFLCEEGHQDFTAWAHGTLPAAQTLTTQMGLNEARGLLVMERPLVGVAQDRDFEHEIEGWNIKPINVDKDLDALVELNATSFEGHPEQGKLTATDFRQRFDQDWFDPGLLYLVRSDVGSHPDVIDSDGDFSAAFARQNGSNGTAPQAFLWMKPVNGTTVELYSLGVSPMIQGKGLGGALSKAMLKIMRAHGYSRAILYVDSDNEPAVRAYSRAGFRVTETHTAYGLPCTNESKSDNI